MIARSRLSINVPLSLPRRGSRDRPRTGRRARARVAVVASVLGFIALQLAFHYPVAAFFPQVRDVEYGKKLARLRRVVAAKPPDRPLVVALGSSMTAMGFCPAALPDQVGGGSGRPLCYNFAINSCGVVVQQLCLRRLLAEGIRPDTVLVEFTPYFLYRPHNLVNDGEFLPARRLVAGDFPVLGRYHPDMARLRADWRGHQVLPWWANRNNLQQWADPDSVPRERRADKLWRDTDRWGWEVIHEWLDRYGPDYAYYAYPEVSRAIREYCFDFTGRPDPQMEAAYADLADLCHREGIRPVFVHIPEASIVREGYHPDGTRRLSEFVRRLQVSHGVVMVDARDWLADAEFVDGYHPYPRGAHTYTTRLDREVLRALYPAR